MRLRWRLSAVSDLADIDIIGVFHGARDRG